MRKCATRTFAYYVPPVLAREKGDRRERETERSEKMQREREKRKRKQNEREREREQRETEEKKQERHRTHSSPLTRSFIRYRRERKMRRCATRTFAYYVPPVLAAHVFGCGIFCARDSQWWTKPHFP